MRALSSSLLRAYAATKLQRSSSQCPYLVWIAVVKDIQLSWLGQPDNLPVLALHTDAPLSKRMDAHTCSASPPRSTTTCQGPFFGTARLTGLFVAYPP